MAGDKCAIVNKQSFEGAPELSQKRRKMTEVDELDILLCHAMTDIFTPYSNIPERSPACEWTLGKRSKVQ